jgi:hypothetical protein
MPPLIIKNCLPLRITFKFKDSSGKDQIVVLQKEEERNFFCFAMNENIKVDIELDGFNLIKNYKLFNLDKNRASKNRIMIENSKGQQTTIYAKSQPEACGQRVIFFCRKLLIDAIDSLVNFYYQKPSMFGNKEKEMTAAAIPFINLGLMKQRVYILPDMISDGRKDKESAQFVYASLDGSFSRNDCEKVDTTTISTPFEFQLQTKGT